MVTNPQDDVPVEEEEEFEILHPAPIITITQFMKQPLESVDFDEDEDDEDEDDEDEE